MHAWIEASAEARASLRAEHAAELEAARKEAREGALREAEDVLRELRDAFIAHGNVPGLIASSIAKLRALATQPAPADVASRAVAAIEREIHGFGLTMEDVRKEASIHASCESVALARALCAALDALGEGKEGSRG